MPPTHSVVCYGDSLTWGYNPNPVSRYPFEVRWPNVLEAELGGKVRVHSEGLNGRKTAFDDKSVVEDRNGLVTLPVVLATHKPIDLVIILLGTNDLKLDAPGSTLHAQAGVRQLVQLTKGFLYKYEYKAPKILLVAPPPLTYSEAPLFEAFKHALDDSKRFGAMYKAVAEEESVLFFDAGSVCSADPHDGVHLSGDSTIALGKAIAKHVAEILNL
jgi:lysophospholipase L1-like esterase